LINYPLTGDYQIGITVFVKWLQKEIDGVFYTYQRVDFCLASCKHCSNLAVSCFFNSSDLIRRR